MNPLSPSSTKVAIEDELEAIPEDETTPLKSFKEMEEEKEAEKKKQQRFVRPGGIGIFTLITICRMTLL